MELTDPLGPRLAEGRTAEVFGYGELHVIKLYRPGYPVDEAMNEFIQARAAFACGAPTPEPVRHGTLHGRPAVVFTRVTGTTLLERLRAAPDTISQIAGALAESHARIHATRPSGIRSLHAYLASRLASKSEALDRLEALPRGNTLCHGDFHPGNVLLTDSGEPMVLDWVTVAQGPPEADVGRSLLLIRGGGLEDEDSPEGALRRAFADAYFARYCALLPLDKRVLESWLPILARVRRTEGPLPAAELRLLDAIEAGSWEPLLSPTGVAPSGGQPGSRR